MKKQSIAALDMIKAVYEDSEATINKRIYKITKTNHRDRRTVFAFFTKYKKELAEMNFSFLETPEFEKVEYIINDIVLFNGSLISKLPDHWEKYPEDYMIFIINMIQVISYPFFQDVVGG